MTINITSRYTYTQITIWFIINLTLQPSQPTTRTIFLFLGKGAPGSVAVAQPFIKGASWGLKNSSFHLLPFYQGNLETSLLSREFGKLPFTKVIPHCIQKVRVPSVLPSSVVPGLDAVAPNAIFFAVSQDCHAVIKDDFPAHLAHELSFPSNPCLLTGELQAGERKCHSRDVASHLQFSFKTAKTHHVNIAVVVVQQPQGFHTPLWNLFVHIDGVEPINTDICLCFVTRPFFHDPPLVASVVPPFPFIKGTAFCPFIKGAPHFPFNKGTGGLAAAGRFLLCFLCWWHHLFLLLCRVIPGHVGLLCF